MWNKDNKRNKRKLWEKDQRWAENMKVTINESLQQAAGKAGGRDKMREQGDMETGVEERENWSSQTRVCRPDDQTPRSSSTAPVPKLSISNSRMWIFICADVPKAKRPSKIDFSARIPEEPNLSWRKAKVRNEIKLCRKSPCCQMKKTEMQMSLTKPMQSAELSHDYGKSFIFPSEVHLV